uniref:Uncharacterized protein n=1 Tax=Anguilla anguilla TaxID=7936 RepID=A0A0E9UKV5_ANGAN
MKSKQWLKISRFLPRNAKQTLHKPQQM